MTDGQAERVSQLLVQARTGDQAACGELIQPYQDWLLGIARQRLDARLAARLSPEDLVQQALLESTRGLSRFRGNSEPELRVWLVRVLERTLAQAERTHLGTEARAAGRELRLDDSAPGAPPPPAADTSTPSQRASRVEESERLLLLIERLPADQRIAVRLRHFESRSLAEIAQELERSPVAVAGLIKRGLATLRELVEGEGA